MFYCYNLTTTRNKYEIFVPIFKAYSFDNEFHLSLTGGAKGHLLLNSFD